MNRAAFLDRDGVINRKAPGDEYILTWEDVQILPGTAQAIALLNEAGFRVIVVSNQRCVANGLVTANEVESIHERMCQALAENGANVDAVYYCPHELHPACNCRKPRPGMLLEGARAYDIDLAKSWIIGDSDIDIEAGTNAGCRTARLLGTGNPSNSKADVVATSLLDAVHVILKGTR